jgi:predicted component of type VI protein secretion system
MGQAINQDLPMSNEEFAMAIAKLIKPSDVRAMAALIADPDNDEWTATFPVVESQRHEYQAVIVTCKDRDLSVFFVISEPTASV